MIALYLFVAVNLTLATGLIVWSFIEYRRKRYYHLTDHMIYGFLRREEGV